MFLADEGNVKLRSKLKKIDRLIHSVNTEELTYLINQAVKEMDRRESINYKETE